MRIVWPSEILWKACLAALGIAAIFFFWFVGSLISAARKHKRPNFILLSLCGCFVLLSGAAFFSCAGMLPPPHIPKPQIEVHYVGPKVSPDGKTACFIKIVSQFSTRMSYQGGWMPNTGWYEESYLVWSKCFLCRGDSNGRNPVVVAELPPDRFRWENNYLFTGPVAFTVAWKQQKAVTVVNRLHDNVSFLDLVTGKCESHTITDPQPRSPTAVPFDHFECVYIEPIEADSEVLWCMGNGVIGTLGFQGNAKVIDLRDHFEGLPGYSPEAERRMAEIQKNSRGFSWPVWNEEQRVFAIEVTSRYSGGTVPHEIWIFNSKLEPVDKFSFNDLSRELQPGRRNEAQPEPNYGWVVSKLSETLRLSGRNESTGPSDAASYYNSNVGAEPNPAEFQFKNHTVEQTRVKRRDAAAIW